MLLAAVFGQQKYCADGALTLIRTRYRHAHMQIADCQVASSVLLLCWDIRICLTPAALRACLLAGPRTAAVWPAMFDQPVLAGASRAGRL
jgi:hypothetical protein